MCMNDLKVTLVDISSLKPHEMYMEDHVRLILEDLKSRGVLVKPVVVEREKLVLLDGHHRFEAFRRLRLKVIPAVLVDYWDPRIVVKSWRDGVEFDKREVLRRAVEGELFPPKTTRHVFVEGGVERHISEVVPIVNVSLSRLAAVKWVEVR